jgi:hypothetical protein
LASAIPVLQLLTKIGFSFDVLSCNRLNDGGSGMSKDQWNKLKQSEKNKGTGKNLGAAGITTFKSRTFAEWQKAGGKNLFPVDPRKVKDPKDLPYMQRPGGSADDADLKKKQGGFSFFGKKKEAPKAAAEPEQKKNWWTL